MLNSPIQIPMHKNNKKVLDNNNTIMLPNHFGVRYKNINLLIQFYFRGNILSLNKTYPNPQKVPNIYKPCLYDF